MAVKATPSIDQSRTQFKRRLARRTVVQLLLLTMIPFLVLGAFAVMRLRGQLEQQINTQVLSISNYYAKQLTDFAKVRGDSLSELIYSSSVSENLPILVSATTKDATYTTARFFVQSAFSTSTAISADAVFDQLLVVRPDGTVAYSTYDLWEGEEYGKLPFMASSLDTDSAQLVYNPQPLYNDQLVLITSRIVRDANGQHIATIFGTTLSTMPKSLLTYAETLLPAAKPYYYTYDQNLIGLENATVVLNNLQVTSGQRSAIEELISQGSEKLHIIQSALTGVESFALAKQIEALQTYFIVSIPTETVYSQIQVFSLATVLLFFAAIALVGVIIYIGTNRTIR
ncbi:hypothetical protein FDZ73_20580, partial [bacterium]